MVSGIELTPKEKEFIIENKDTMFPGQIAQELSNNMALENGGYRSRDTVKKFLKVIF